MVSANAIIVYCIDTSSLVNIQRIYHLTKLEGIWEFLDVLTGDGRLSSPKEVLAELEEGQDDEIYEWAKNHPGMFRQLTQAQWLIGKDIANDPKYKGFIDPDKEIPDADPFVIALAIDQQKQERLIPEKWVIVADENQKKKLKIPDVCRDPKYNVECISTQDLFRREGLRLVRMKT